MTVWLEEGIEVGPTEYIHDDHDHTMRHPHKTEDHCAQADKGTRHSIPLFPLTIRL